MKVSLSMIAEGLDGAQAMIHFNADLTWIPLELIAATQDFFPIRFREITYSGYGGTLLQTIDKPYPRMTGSLEDKICQIIRAEYQADGYEDEGRSDAAAHHIMAILPLEALR